MTRRRKNTEQNSENGNSNNTENNQDVLMDFAKEYAKSLHKAQVNPLVYNTIWQNDLLKNVNMSPQTFTREKIEQLISNPKDNEDALRNLGQYLMNTIMQFNRLVHYYSTILTFDYYIIASNADEDDFADNSYKKSRKKVVNWLENLNPKLVFPNVMKGVILEDAKFYYVHSKNDSVMLYEMPQKYCKIISKTEYGYQYAFNMYYFLQAGINVHDFPPEFAEYFSAFISNKKGSSSFYWQPLDPVKAPVFKFDENRAGITPPLLGLFLDSAEIDAYKKLLKTKTQLEIWKLLLAKIPLKQDQKGGKTMNEFAIDPATAGQFAAIMQTGVPEGVKVIASPLETEPVDFSQSQTQNNIVGIGQDIFYKSAGTSPIMFGEAVSTVAGVSASIKVDENYVFHMYRQFERFIKAYLKLHVSKRYRFKAVFPDITRFNWKEKYEVFFKSAQHGYSKTLVSVAMGIDPEDMNNLIKYENTLNLLDIMKPLSSSHVQSGDVSKGGRPTVPEEDLSDEGAKSRDS